MFVGNRKTKIYLLTITGIALTLAIGFFLSNLKCKKIIEDNIFLGIKDVFWKKEKVLQNKQLFNKTIELK